MLSQPAPLSLVQPSQHFQPQHSPICLHNVPEGPHFGKHFFIGTPSLAGATLSRPLPLALHLSLPRSQPPTADLSAGALTGATSLTLLNLVLTICGQKSEGGQIPIRIDK